MMRPLLTFLLVYLAVFLYAQEKPTISTDRPSQSAGSSIVPIGSIQVESGFVSEDAGGTNTNLNTLIRWGVNEFFELRFQQDLLSAEVGNETFNGWAPTVLGMKIRLAEEDGWMPEMALIGNLILESGESIFQSPNSTPEFRFATFKTLSDKWYLGYNLGMRWDADSPESTTQYSIIVGTSLTDKLGFFLEPYGFSRQDSAADSRLNGGFTYLVMNNFQADLSGGVGITDRSPDSFISFGVSGRF